MANIIVTGATGFLGKNLCERLSLDLSNNIWKVRRGDPINKLEVEQFSPDYIFHFGAEIYDESVMMESNILLTHRLLEATRDVNYKAFVNLGSSSEYGLKKKPMCESDVLVPRTMYEATKASATLLCQAYANMMDKPIVTIRPFSVYGRHEPLKRFIPTIADRFFNRESIKISEGVHDFIYIDDFIDGVLTVAYSPSEIISGDIVNMGTGTQYSNFEVYDIFSILFGYDIPVEKLEQKLRPYDSQTWVADTNHAKKTYGICPKYSLIEGLKEFCNERFNNL